MMTDAIWVPVKGYEGLYEVSSTGYVRSVERVTHDGKHLSGKILSLCGYPYLHVDLWKDGKGSSKLVHRIVAEAFISNPDNFDQVDHIDGNKCNNRYDNLQWVSASANSCKRNRLGCRKYNTRIKCLETGQVYSSISAAARSISTDATRIIESIQAESCCKGYTFVYLAELPSDEESYMKSAHSKYQSYHSRPNCINGRRVLAVELNKQFDSIAEAARFFNCDTATVSNRIKSGRTWFGVTLQYID